MVAKKAKKAVVSKVPVKPAVVRSEVGWNVAAFIMSLLTLLLLLGSVLVAWAVHETKDNNTDLAEYSVGPAAGAPAPAVEAYFDSARRIGRTEYFAKPVLFLDPAGPKKKKLSKYKWGYANNYLIIDEKTGKESLLVKKRALLYDLSCDYEYWPDAEKYDMPYFYYLETDGDSNKNGKIDCCDESHAFAYRLADGKITQLDPPGTSAISVNASGHGPFVEMKVYRSQAGSKPGSYEYWSWDKRHPEKMSLTAGPELRKDLKAAWDKQN